MTVLEAYYIGCDAPVGDGYCMNSTWPPEPSYDVAYAKAIFDGWVDADGLHICSYHAGTDA